jgi:TolB-like protein
MGMDIVSDQEKIKEQVGRILSSSPFKNSQILSNFLSYVVSVTLAGEKETLKEYVIATKVLKKKTDFNPQLNAIVRIHARRLRNSLENYYINIGRNDPILISMPKGRYVPAFEYNRNHPTERRSSRSNFHIEKPEKPVIAVMPLRVHEEDQRILVICSVFSQDLSIEFSRFSEIAVISSYSSQKAHEKLSDIEEIGQHLGAEYLITGSCYPDGHRIKLNIELNSIRKNQIIWADTYFIENSEKNRLVNYRSIIRQIVAATCGYFGVIYRDSLNDQVPEDYDVLFAVYWYNRYHRYFSEESYREALKAIKIGIQKNPRNALLWAFQGELYLNARVMDLHEEIDYVITGTKSVQISIDIDPTCQHAYQVLTWANVLKHDKNEFRRSISKLLTLNPNNSSFLGAAGFACVCAGEYEEGLKYMSESIQLNPYHSWYLNVGFFLYYLVAREFEEAVYWAELINRPHLFWDPLFKASVYGWLGNAEKAKDVSERLLYLSPKFPDRARDIVDLFILDDKLKDMILEGLLKAGIPVLI